MSDVQSQTERQTLESRRVWTAEEIELRRTRVSWGAIFAGAVVAVVANFVLNLLGFGIGALVVSPTDGGQAQTLGIGAAIWTFVATIIALFVGGWIAGRLSSSSRTFEGILHGVVTWSLVTVAVLWLVGSAIGTVVGGAFGLVGQAAPAAIEQTQQPGAGQAQQQIEEQAGQVGQQAQQVAGQAGNITGGAAIVLAIAMMLGGAASAGGGAVAAKRRRKEEPRGEPQAVH